MSSLKVSRVYFKASVLYMLSTLLSKAIPFLLIPFLTYHLEPAQFGYIGLFSVVLAITSVYIGLRPEVYYIKRSAELGLEESEKCRDSLITLVFISAIMVAPVVFIGCYFLLGDLKDASYFFIFAVIISLLQGIKKIYETQLQIDLKVNTYVICNVLFSALNVSLTYLFIKYLNNAWYYKIGAELLATFCLVCFFLYNFRVRFKNIFNFSNQKKDIKDAYNYLWPLTFHVLGFSLLNLSDRLIIDQIMGKEAVGLYAVIYSFGMLLGVVHDSVLKAWNPYFYKAYQIKEKHKHIFRLQICYVFFALLLWVVFSLLGEWIYKLVVDDKYHGVVQLLPILALAYTFEGIRKIFCGYLYVNSKTKLLSLITVFCVILNIILNLIYVPVYGLKGAAISTTVAFFIMFLLTIISTVKYERKKHKNINSYCNL